jgi:hypothetical protein
MATLAEESGVPGCLVVVLDGYWTGFGSTTIKIRTCAGSQVLKLHI